MKAAGRSELNPMWPVLDQTGRDAHHLPGARTRTRGFPPPRGRGSPFLFTPGSGDARRTSAALFGVGLGAVREKGGVLGAPAPGAACPFTGRNARLLSIGRVELLISVPRRKSRGEFLHAATAFLATQSANAIMNFSRNTFVSGFVIWPSAETSLSAWPM